MELQDKWATGLHENPGSWLSSLVSNQASSHMHMFAGDHRVSASASSLRPCLFTDPTTKCISVRSQLQFSSLAQQLPSGWRTEQEGSRRLHWSRVLLGYDALSPCTSTLTFFCCLADTAGVCKADMWGLISTSPGKQIETCAVIHRDMHWISAGLGWCSGSDRCWRRRKFTAFSSSSAWRARNSKPQNFITRTSLHCYLEPFLQQQNKHTTRYLLLDVRWTQILR